MHPVGFSPWVRGAFVAALVGVAALVACGSGDNAEAAADPRCRTIREQHSEVTHELCCKEPGEVAAYQIACGRHVAIGCEGELYCTVYTDDDAVTHACMSAASCRECARTGDTGLQLWCRDRITGD